MTCSVLYSPKTQCWTHTAVLNQIMQRVCSDTALDCTLTNTNTCTDTGGGIGQNVRANPCRSKRMLCITTGRVLVLLAVPLVQEPRALRQHITCLPLCSNIRLLCTVLLMTCFVVSIPKTQCWTKTAVMYQIMENVCSHTAFDRNLTLTTANK